MLRRTGLPLFQADSGPAGGEIGGALLAAEALPLEGVRITGDATFAQRELCAGIQKTRPLSSMCWT